MALWLKMGQLEVLQVLKEANKWVTMTEVKARLELKGITNGALKGLCSDLRRLCACNLIDIKLKMVDKFNTIPIYKYKGD